MPRVVVNVMPKAEILDPQGQAIGSARPARPCQDLGCAAGQAI